MGLRGIGAPGAGARGEGRAGVSSARSPHPSALHQLITRTIAGTAKSRASSAVFLAFRRPREASALLPPRATECHHVRVAYRFPRRARHARVRRVAGRIARAPHAPSRLTARRGLRRTVGRLGVVPSQSDRSQGRGGACLPQALGIVAAWPRIKSGVTQGGEVSEFPAGAARHSRFRLHIRTLGGRTAAPLSPVAPDLIRGRCLLSASTCERSNPPPDRVRTDVLER